MITMKRKNLTPAAIPLSPSPSMKDCVAIFDQSVHIARELHLRGAKTNTSKANRKFTSKVANTVLIIV